MIYFVRVIIKQYIKDDIGRKNIDINIYKYRIFSPFSYTILLYYKKCNIICYNMIFYKKGFQYYMNVTVATPTVINTFQFCKIIYYPTFHLLLLYYYKYRGVIMKKIVDRLILYSNKRIRLDHDSGNLHRDQTVSWKQNDVQNKLIPEIFDIENSFDYGSTE